jgi:hypothetical protein
MNAIDRGTLLRLADHSEWPCVSIYTPVDHTGAHTDADRLRLRNLVKQAAKQLVHDGLREAAADSMLAGAAAIAADETVWAGGPAGLAVFVTPSSTEALWVDISLPDLVIVGDRFYLRPLYAAYVGEKKAWALAIDSNKTRLFHFDPVSIEEVALPEGTPTSLAAEEQYDTHETTLQFHTVPGAGKSGGTHAGGAAMFHGQGGEKDFDKAARERFMQELGRGVATRIGADSNEPLVLLGVDYMIEDFRATSAYSHIAPEQVDGATDYLSPNDVRRKVLEALAPRDEVSGRAAVDEYRALTGTGKTSADAAEIVAAAASGRVKTLIIDDSSGPWGWFDPKTFAVTRLCEIEPHYLRATTDPPEEHDMFECGWDLLDLAAAETLRHNGSVHAYRGEDSPFLGGVAVFRY